MIWVFILFKFILYQCVSIIIIFYFIMTCMHIEIPKCAHKILLLLLSLLLLLLLSLSATQATLIFNVQNIR